MSPTISSTTSSRVTTPAVPPYSSETIAIWKPSPRSRSSRGSRRSDSGTTVASTITSRIRVSSRSERGTATACLTCTEPTTLSEDPLMTGNLEKPVAPESSMISLTGSLASTQAICTRGVMISPAVRGPKATDRCTS